MDFKEEIIALLKKHHVNATTLLEMPSNPSLGEYALPCFTFAKTLKKAPLIIAQELAQQLQNGQTTDFLDKVIATGPYVNFFIKPGARAKATITAINNGVFWNFGCGNKKILIEYPSPNTNKPLHLGHIRNIVLGSTLTILFKRDGNEVIQVNLNNDRGVHICKSMLAYKNWGNDAPPNKKSDHYVGDYYVLFQKEAQKNPALEEEAQTMLLAWENDDPETRALWKLMNNWALQGFNETYKRYHIHFDKEYYESQIYQEGKKIVLEHIDQLTKDDTGAVIAPLQERFNLPDKILLRKDGTAIYMTQDIALTIQKINEFKPDLQLWIVANEQQLHFQQLFAILEMLGVKGRENFFHFSYGMVNLPEGRMKSREGRVIDADDLLDEMEQLAAEEIKKRRQEWSESKIREKSKIVALGAIRFFIIKYDPLKDFTFDQKTSLNFEGDTGPYLQYTHARICSILAKTTYRATADVTLLTATEEQELLRQLSAMPDAYRKAVQEYKPSTIAMQLLEIGRAFNSFYQACPVLAAKEDLQSARLQLIEAVRRVLDEGLSLLGIEAPKEM